MKKWGIEEMIGSDLQPLQNASLILEIGNSENSAKCLEWTKLVIERGSTAL